MEVRRLSHFFSDYEQLYWFIPRAQQVEEEGLAGARTTAVQGLVKVADIITTGRGVDRKL